MVGAEPIEVPAAVIACSSCHGRNGRGAPEGGIRPSNLSWESLTRPYRVRDRTSGREHPPYTEELVKKAVTSGIDPAGHSLGLAMPRYRMSDHDLDDLIAYLRERLGNEADPGVGATSIVVGTVLPPGSVGSAVRAALEAGLHDINAGGGIYGRSLALRFAPTAPGDTKAAIAARWSALARGEVFALVAPWFSDRAEELAALAAQHLMPVVAPLTHGPQVSSPPSPYVFYLLPGLEAQGRALVDFVANRATGSHRSATLLPARQAGLDAVAAAIDKRAQERGLDVVDRIEYWQAQFDGGAAALRLTETKVDTVFFLGPGRELRLLMDSVHRLGLYPRFLCLGVMLGSDGLERLPPWKSELVASFPLLPPPGRGAGVQTYRRLAATYRLPAEHRAVQRVALAGVQVVAEGLRRAGRDLSRPGFIEALETLREFDTGLTPPVTYGPNRRLGILDAAVIALPLPTAHASAVDAARQAASHRDPPAMPAPAPRRSSPRGRRK